MMEPRTTERTSGMVLIPDCIADTPLIAWNQRGMYIETVSMVAPTQNWDAPPKNTLRWSMMRAGTVAVVLRVRYCHNMKRTNSNAKMVRRAMILGDDHGYSDAPHSSASNRHVIEGRKRAVPSGSRFFCFFPVFQFRLLLLQLEHEAHHQDRQATQWQVDKKAPSPSGLAASEGSAE